MENCIKFPNSLFNETNDSNITERKLYNPTLLRELAGEKNKMDENQLNNENAKKRINP